MKTRYAVVGYVTWHIGRRVVRNMLKRGKKGGSGAKKAGVVAAGAAALAGLLFWRRRKKGEGEGEYGSSEPPAAPGT